MEHYSLLSWACSKSLLAWFCKMDQFHCIGPLCKTTVGLLILGRCIARLGSRLVQGAFVGYGLFPYEDTE